MSSGSNSQGHHQLYSRSALLMEVPGDDVNGWRALVVDIDRRQRLVSEGLELIPSENFTFVSVMQAVGSVMTNKYNEGYPGARYYGGNELNKSTGYIDYKQMEKSATLFRPKLIVAGAGASAYARLYDYGCIRKNIELSKEMNESFNQSSQARTKLPSGIEMSVHVLMTGYWPTYPLMDVLLPYELNVYQDIFKEFYLSKYSGRRLMWHNSSGHCVLKAEFPKGKKEPVVSLFQVGLLMV